MHTSSLVAYHITSFMLYESSYTDVHLSVRLYVRVFRTYDKNLYPFFSGHDRRLGLGRPVLALRGKFV